MELLKKDEQSHSKCRDKLLCPDLLKYAYESRKNGYFNDVSIITDDDKTIPANRMVLSCHSTFFEKMFNIDMKEKCEHDVVVKGVEGEAVETLIEYIYAGSLDINSENVMDLLSASDYLQLDDVTEFCFDFLESIIAEDNCFAILSATTLFANKNLSGKVLQFISDNFDELSKTEDFLSLSKENMIACISNTKHTLINAMSVYEAIIRWTKNNPEQRKVSFSHLFLMVDLNNLPGQFLEDVVAKEELIRGSVSASKFLIDNFSERLKSKQVGENVSKIVSLGGFCTMKMVTEVFNLHGHGQSPEVFGYLPKSFQENSALKFRDYVYCIGGRAAGLGNDVWRCRVQDKKLKTWTKVASMPQQKSSMDAALFRGALVVAGGKYEQKSLASAECYTPQTNGWRYISSLNRRRHNHALASSDEGLLALGGMSDSICTSTAEQLKELNGKWEYVKPMNEQRCGLTAVNCNGFIYAIGGKSGATHSSTLKSVEKYDSESKRWIFVSSMNRERYDHAACVLQGKVYVIGGVDAKAHPVMEIECYEPHQDKWFVVGVTVKQLYGHAVVDL